MDNKNSYGLTKLETESIFGYTIGTFFTELNDQLRRGEESTLLMKEILLSGLRKMNVSTGVHYRGIDLDGSTLESFLKEHSKGNTVVYNDFVSAGSVKKGSFYEKESNNVKITLISKTAVDISELSDGILFHGLSPREALFLPNTKFRVLNKTKEGNVYFIDLEEL